MELKQLYQDIILEHGKSPRNLGKCEGYSHYAKGYNPLCGDKVHVYLKLDKGKKVGGLTFEGDGCAISLASASIMTELVKGKSFEETKEIMNAFLNMIKNTSEIQSNHLDNNQKTKLMSLSGVKEFPMRVKCATLSWHTLVSAMEGRKREVNTEEEKMSDIKNKVIEEIKKIYDPEIPVNIYELGLIYKIEVDEKNKVNIDMTLTSPNCPVAESLPNEVKDNIKKVEGVSDVNLNIVREPPWDKDKMSEAAKLELNL